MQNAIEFSTDVATNIATDDAPRYRRPNRTATAEWLEHISTPESRHRGGVRGGLATQHLNGRHEFFPRERCPLCEKDDGSNDEN